MATFNGTCENAYAQQLMGEFFGNSLRYFKGEVRGSEYFRPVMSMLGEREMEQRIYDRCGGEALVKCGVARTCCLAWPVDTNPAVARGILRAGGEIWYNSRINQPTKKESRKWAR